MSSRQEAIRDARSHIEKGTGLSDDAVRRICQALLEGCCMQCGHPAGAHFIDCLTLRGAAPESVK